MLPQERLDQALRSIGKVDLVVVGAGIYGAAIAYEATSRGLTAVLLDKGDFGAGASANSLRIIHGGLRYLQSLNLSRARKSAMERSVLLRIFPGLIQPMKFAVMLGGSLKRSPPVMAAGLTLNALLTADRNHNLPKDSRIRAGGLTTGPKLGRACPHLMEGAKGTAAYWYDGLLLDPDRALTEMIWVAKAAGAAVLNYTEAVKYLETGGQIRGVLVRDSVNGHETEIEARVVMDCTGAGLVRNGLWAEEFRRLGQVGYIRAINLVVDCPLSNLGVGAWSLRGRYLFAVPTGDKVSIGTWYLPLKEKDGPPRVSEAERAAMLQEIKETFPGRPNFSDAICSQQIGVLPCHADDLAAPDPQPIPAPVVLRGEQMGGPVGLWVVQGEKWTTARYMADRVVTEMAARHNFPIKPSASADTVLVGKSCPGFADADDGGFGHAKKRLELRRGLAAGEILRKAMSHPEASRVVSGRTDVYRSEVEFALANEDIVKLSDLARRLGIGQLARLSEKSLTDLVEMAAKVKNWDETEQRLQLEDYTLDPRWS